MNRQVIQFRIRFPKTLLVCSALVLLCVSVHVPEAIGAEDPSKDKILAKYDEALNLAQKLNIYQEDILEMPSAAGSGVPYQ